jgi:hypothetical protein
MAARYYSADDPVRTMSLYPAESQRTPYNAQFGGDRTVAERQHEYDSYRTAGSSRDTGYGENERGSGRHERDGDYGRDRGDVRDRDRGYGRDQRDPDDPRPRGDGPDREYDRDRDRGYGREAKKYGRETRRETRREAREYDRAREYSRDAKEYDGDTTKEFGWGTRDYGRDAKDYGRDAKDYGRDAKDYGRDAKDYGRDAKDYGRDTRDYGRDAKDYGRDAKDYGRDTRDYGRDAKDYGRSDRDYGREARDYGRSDRDYGRDARDYGREARDYGRSDRDREQDRGRERSPESGAYGRYRDDDLPEGRDRFRGKGSDRNDRPGRGPARSGAIRLGSSPAPSKRAPLLIRGTLAAAALLALAASIVRAIGMGGAPGPNGNGQATLVLGQGTTPAIQAAAPAAAGATPYVTAAAQLGQAGGQGMTAEQERQAAVAATGISCQVRYSVTARSATQFTAVVTVLNTSAVPVKGWALRWRYPSKPRLSAGWNAVVTNETNGALARGVGANRVIPAGGSSTIGFVGTFNAAGTGLGTGMADPAQPAPTGFSLNGVMCR